MLIVFLQLFTNLLVIVLCGILTYGIYKISHTNNLKASASIKDGNENKYKNLFDDTSNTHSVREDIHRYNLDVLFGRLKLPAKYDGFKTLFTKADDSDTKNTHSSKEDIHRFNLGLCDDTSNIPTDQKCELNDFKEMFRNKYKNKNSEEEMELLEKLVENNK